jgi:hypothetical protein
MQSNHYGLPSPRLTRGEYWLMEIMAEYMIPAGFLARDDLDKLLNKQHHGLSQDELLATIFELSQQGLVSFITRHDQTERQFSNTDQIREALAEESRRGQSKTFLCLTADGGRVWEAFAAPRWNDYIADSYGFDESLGQDVTELICANRGLLERYLKSRYPSFSQIDPSRLWWDILEPWEATYWKTLPKAHRVRFVDPDDEADETPPPSWHMRYFFRSGWYSWD